MKEGNINIIVVFASSILGIFISDIYIPSIPKIQIDLGATRYILELSISMYFIFFSLSQLAYGVLSERIGRRPIFIYGLSISLIGCFITVTSESITQLLIGRAIEAIGMGGPMSIGKAMIRDMIKDDTEYIRVLSYLGSFVLFAPIVSPLFGAYIADIWSWRADFLFIAFLNILCLVLAIFKLEETLKIKISSLSTKHALMAYINVLKSKSFRQSLITSSLIMGSMFLYLSLSSFLFQNELGLSEIEYGWTIALGNIFIALGMLGNTYLIKYFGINKTMQYSLIIILISSLILVVQLFYILNISVLISIVIFNISCGIILPISSANSILEFKDKLGIVSSLFSSLVMLIAGTTAALYAQAKIPAIAALACAFIGTSIIGLIINNT